MPPTPSEDVPASAQDAINCVVLIPPGGTVDEGLPARLAERRWSSVTCEDPLLAMAELCVQERLQASREAWGLKRSQPVALVIVAPHARRPVAELNLLFEAVRSYLGTVSIWLYTDGALSKLAEPTAEDARREAGPPREPVSPASAAVAAVVARAAPQLRLTEPIDRSGQRGPTPSGDEAAPGTADAAPPPSTPETEAEHATKTEAEAQAVPEADTEPGTSKVTRQELDMLFERDHEATP